MNHKSLSRPALSKVSLAAVLFFAAFLIVIFKLLHSPVMANYIRERLISEARARGIPLRLERTECGFSGCRAQNVYVLIPKAFASFLIEELIVSPDFLRIFSGGMSVKIGGTMYGGKLSGALSISHADGTLTATFRAEGMDAGKVPQLSGIGVSSGEATLVLNSLRVQGNTMSFEPSTITILRAAKPVKTTLPPLATGAPIPIDIPAIASLDLNINADMKDGGIHIAQAALKSSLGDATVMGGISLKQSLPVFALSGQAEVSEQGRRDIAMLFGAGSPDLAASLPRKLRFRLGGTSSSPDFTFDPIP